MNMNKLYDLKETMCRDLDDIAGKGNLSAGDLELAHKLTDTIKNICKIVAMEEGGYSGDGEWMADMRGSYGNGRSYRDRPRDSMGRYSGNYNTRYYRAGIKDRLQDMMDEAGTEREREAIRRCMESIN